MLWLLSGTGSLIHISKGCKDCTRVMHSDIATVNLLGRILCRGCFFFLKKMFNGAWGGGIDISFCLESSVRLKCCRTRLKFFTLVWCFLASGLAGGEWSGDDNGTCIFVSEIQIHWTHLFCDTLTWSPPIQRLWHPIIFYPVISFRNWLIPDCNDKMVILFFCLLQALILPDDCHFLYCFLVYLTRYALLFAPTQRSLDFPMLFPTYILQLIWLIL